MTLNRDAILPLLGGFGVNPSVGTQTKIKIVDPFTNTVKTELNIEIADTKEERIKGLGGRESLASEAGMLFVFDKEDIHNFWMKGMKIPLDFIWINNDQVVDLLANVSPPPAGQADNNLPILAPVTKINKVLEVNAGLIKNHNISIGDQILQK